MQKTVNLSGGNQQKVVVAKSLYSEPDILIMDEPTRGIDVGAKYEIYKLIHQLADQGKAVILVSSELPELLGMSDRIMVVHEGKVTGIMDGKTADEIKATWADDVARFKEQRKPYLLYEE